MRCALKIGHSLIPAIPAHQFQSPAITLIRLDELSQNGIDQGPSSGFMAEAIEDFRTFRKAFDNARVSHEFQMPGDAWLALLKHTRQLHDCQLFARQQPQNPETCGFSSRSQNFDHLFRA